MNVSVAVRLDRLLRALRLTGHALAERAEAKALRSLRQGVETKLPRSRETADPAGKGKRR